MRRPGKTVPAVKELQEVADYDVQVDLSIITDIQTAINKAIKGESK